jgi:hypothetical protein
MKLSENLKACGFEGTTEEFKGVLIRIMQSDFPTTTIDTVLSTPAVATRYCEAVRESCPDANLHDLLVLSTLMGIRKRKECPKKLIGGPSEMRLSKLLANSGCSMHVDEFRKLIADCLVNMYPDQTIHAIICHPRESLALCEFIKSKVQVDSLPHALILRVLLSIRRK